MENEIKPELLTPEEIQAYSDQADTISKEKGYSKVHVCVQVSPGTNERRACFLKHPNFVTQLAVMDKMTGIGVWMGANELREACVLKEYSDPLTYGDSPECDGYKMGVSSFCMTIIEKFSNAYTKKN